jgi:hypothetical protein
VPTLWKTAEARTAPLLRSRRAVAPLLATLALTGVVPWRGPYDAQAKRKKKRYCKCASCHTCQKRRCTGVLPDGSPCGPNLMCQAGDCVPV